MKKIVIILLLLVMILTTRAALAKGSLKNIIEVLANVSDKTGNEAVSKVEQFSFNVKDKETILVLDFCTILEKGKVSIKIMNPVGDEIFICSGRKKFAIKNNIFSSTCRIGKYKIAVSMSEAVGSWRARVYIMPKRSALRVYFFTGSLMIMVGVGFVVFWMIKAKTQSRWFWLGAVIWIAGVSVKVIWANNLNNKILVYLESTLSRPLYIITSGAYLGIQSSICEIGITLVFAYIWKRMTEDKDRAVAIGIGAGAFEAIALGIIAILEVTAVISGKPGTENLFFSMVGQSAPTAYSWLASPVERVLAILCHTSSRVLVLMAVAKGKWSYFFWGFLLFASLDSVAGLASISGMIGWVSIWWVELSIFPIAVISVLVIIWCLKNWAPEEKQEEKQIEQSSN